MHIPVLLENPYGVFSEVSKFLRKTIDFSSHLVEFGGKLSIKLGSFVALFYGIPIKPSALKISG